MTQDEEDGRQDGGRTRPDDICVLDEMPPEWRQGSYLNLCDVYGKGGHLPPIYHQLPLFVSLFLSVLLRVQLVQVTRSSGSAASVDI